MTTKYCKIKHLSMILNKMHVSSWSEHSWSSNSKISLQLFINSRFEFASFANVTLYTHKKRSLKAYWATFLFKQGEIVTLINLCILDLNVEISNHQYPYQSPAIPCWTRLKKKRIWEVGEWKKGEKDWEDIIKEESWK